MKVLEEKGWNFWILVYLWMRSLMLVVEMFNIGIKCWEFVFNLFVIMINVIDMIDNGFVFGDIICND